MAANEPPGPLTAQDEDDSRRGALRSQTVEQPPAQPPELVPVPPPEVPGAAKKPVRLSKKKERRLLKDSQRNLDSWERYRALTDVLDEALELVDLADHKARFALVIMGALNALLFIMASQADVFDFIPASKQGLMMAVVLVYALVAVYFVIQAIESLRPRKAQPQVSQATESGVEDLPTGIRFYEDILSRDLESYRKAWRDVRMGQLNAELAVQAHALAQINKAKYTALRRLYLGLDVMTIMAALLMAVGTYLVLSGKAAKVRAGQKAEGPAAKEFTTSGVREPSGVAFHAASGHLFVVGDEGRVAELDTEGRTLRATGVKGNLEDVAVHGPSGDLVLLAEGESELILFDPVAHREKKRWRLDPAAVLGQAPESRNQGFEGLAFREEAGRPGGGVFYLTHQRSPPMLVAIAFDPAKPAGPLGPEAVVGRWPIRDYEDLTAVTYVPSLDRLLVIADKKDRLLVLRTDGTLESDLPLPGKQQEGLALDGAGRLWVADDQQKSLLRIEEGLSMLRPKADGRGTGLRIPG